MFSMEYSVEFYQFYISIEKILPAASAMEKVVFKMIDLRSFKFSIRRVLQLTTIYCTV